ncbi:MAG TPA: hypothetical protein VKT77_12795 [Chthonomonadaceae bacterium]|nr:hypothetical protein [Chthonomonadaceae bacterium]
MPTGASSSESLKPESVRQVRQLLDGLTHTDARERDRARRALDALGLAGAEAVRAICRPSPADRLYLLFAETDFPHWILVVLFAAMVPPLVKLQAGILLLLLGVAAAVVVAKWRIRQSPAREARERQMRGLRWLLTLRDKRIVPILLDIEPLVGRTPDDLVIAPALNLLLPELTEEDGCMLSRRHRARLTEMLRTARGANRVDQRTAVLKALCRVGDRTAIPAVRRLARSREETQYRDTAAACLEQLERRAGGKSQVLLRPQAPSHDPEALVRPASAPHPPEGDLVRPAD